MTRSYRLDDGRQTLVLAAHADRLPVVTYWGPTLPDTDVPADLHAVTFKPDPQTRIITCQTTLDATRPVHLHWLAAPVLPAPQLSDDMIDVSGRWCGEFQLSRTAWSAGMRYRENRTGRTGHEHFPWPKPNAPRPVHYNCWEAVYFDHKLPVLRDIAERAAKLGAHTRLSTVCAPIFRMWKSKAAHRVAGALILASWNAHSASGCLTAMTRWNACASNMTRPCSCLCR